MTFSSSPLPLPAFVERPLPDAGFHAEPRAAAAAPSAAAAPDLAAECARAEEAGFARGRAAGRAEAEAELGERTTRAVAALEAALEALRTGERQQQEALAGAAFALALAVAKHVLRAELSREPDALAPLLGEAISALAPESELVVALAPGDLALVREGRAEVLAALAARWNATLVSDAKLAPGEARLEASGARIELRLEATLARLETALREHLVLAPREELVPASPDALVPPEPRR